MLSADDWSLWSSSKRKFIWSLSVLNVWAVWAFFFFYLVWESISRRRVRVLDAWSPVSRNPWPHLPWLHTSHTGWKKAEKYSGKWNNAHVYVLACRDFGILFMNRAGIWIHSYCMKFNFWAVLVEAGSWEHHNEPSWPIKYWYFLE
jgi:hypothetical protein